MFNPPHVYVFEATHADYLITLLFGGFRRWDAVYFLHIAQYGYTYENTLAFFPLFPILVRFITYTVLWPLLSVMHVGSVMMLAAALINFVCFVMSARALFSLGWEIYQDELFAYYAAQLYCINPGSIFFSAAYSEALFALLLFLALNQCVKDRMILASLLFFLAGFVHASGVLSCGYILFCFIHTMVYRYTQMGKDCTFYSLFFVWTKILLTYVFYILLCLTPFMMFQCYSYDLYCSTSQFSTEIPRRIIHYGIIQHYKILNIDRPVWCNDSLPMPFLHVQSKYWNIGFLRHYELKNYANFVLGLPMTILCLITIVMYVRRRPIFCLTMGFKGLDVEKEIKLKTKDNLSYKEYTVTYHSFYDPVTIAYIIQTTVLLLFGLSFMHVQVCFLFYIYIYIYIYILLHNIVQ